MKFEHMKRIGLALSVLTVSACSAITGAPPKGSEDAIDDAEAAQMKAVGRKVTGTIVWSSSRLGNHDLFTMNTDGSDVKQITKGDQVDWFPRFSPDGSKILFCRSKSGWVSERDANVSEKWDIYTVKPDGSEVVKVVDSASWGSWVGSDEIVFVRSGKILRTKLGSGKETVVVDSAGTDLEGVDLQQPELSPDGKFVAITLRGSKRETGVWDIAKKTWTQTGLGCQINWTPDGASIYWVNPTGNGGSEVFRMPMTNGKPTKELDDDQLRFMDLPGRRSHEYFPQLSADGKWMVWGITQRGHDHDVVDYEIYLWEVGTAPESAVRLTHHSGNDRWPDIFIPAAVASKAPPAEAKPAAAVAAAPAPTMAPVAAKAAPAEPADDPPAKARKRTTKKGKRGK
jgi:Tol biopolymer transport system component